jgi:hypothetical protein
MNTDHIVHNSNTQCMECQHCGFQQAVKMPAPIDAILGKFDAFTEAHKNCKAPIAEAVMSDYVKGFDHGCDYVVREIELWSTKHSYDVIALLAHLKGEGDKTKGIS